MKFEVLGWLQKLKQEMIDSFETLIPDGSKISDKAKQYTQEHLDQKITLPEVADYLGLSANYFSSFFKKQTGQNYIHYVNTQKMERACALLKDKNLKVSMVGAQVGIDNTYYFSRLFKRYTGFTPSEYRQRFLAGIL